MKNKPQGLITIQRDKLNKIKNILEKLGILFVSIVLGYIAVSIMMKFFAWAVGR